jgi:L-seryl-tRNA(Ser) seleniumtransferase
LAGLTATLQAFERDRATDEIPVWQMIARSADTIRATATDWADFFNQSGYQAELLSGESLIGGGSLPGQMLPTTLVALPEFAAQALAKAMREQGVIGRIQNDTVVLDPRTVLPHQMNDLLPLMQQALKAVQAAQQD